MNISSRPSFFDASNVPKYHKRTNLLLSSNAPGSPASRANAGTPDSGFAASPRKEAYFAKGFGEHLKNPDLADVKLCVENEELPAHSLILAFGSEYFRDYFTSPTWKDRSSNRVPLRFDHPCPVTVVREVLEFLYEGSVNVTAANVVPLLKMSSTLGVAPLHGLCVTFLKESVNLTNACAVAADAGPTVWNEADVEGVCFDMISSSFDEISMYGSNFSAFLVLTEDQLTRVLSRSDLQSENESNVLRLVEAWCSAKGVPSTQLISCVRLARCDASTLMQAWKRRVDSGLTTDLMMAALATRVFQVEIGDASAIKAASYADAFPQLDIVSNSRPRAGLPVISTPGFAIWRVPRFAELYSNEDVTSAFFADRQGNQWRIVLAPRSAENPADSTLGIFVELAQASLSALAEKRKNPSGGWKVGRIIRLTLLNERNAAGSVSRASSKNFTDESVRFGWPNFIPLSHIPDFMDDSGTLVVSVHVTDASVKPGSENQFAPSSPTPA